MVDEKASQQTPSSFRETSSRFLKKLTGPAVKVEDDNSSFEKQYPVKEYTPPPGPQSIVMGTDRDEKSCARTLVSKDPSHRTQGTTASSLTENNDNLGESFPVHSWLNKDSSKIQKSKGEKPENRHDRGVSTKDEHTSSEHLSRGNKDKKRGSKLHPKKSIGGQSSKLVDQEEAMILNRKDRPEGVTGSSDHRTTPRTQNRRKKADPSQSNNRKDKSDSQLDEIQVILDLESMEHAKNYQGLTSDGLKRHEEAQFHPVQNALDVMNSIRNATVMAHADTMAAQHHTKKVAADKQPDFYKQVFSDEEENPGKKNDQKKNQNRQTSISLLKSSKEVSAEIALESMHQMIQSESTKARISARFRAIRSRAKIGRELALKFLKSLGGFNKNLENGPSSHPNVSSEGLRNRTSLKKNREDDGMSAFSMTPFASMDEEEATELREAGVTKTSSTKRETKIISSKIARLSGKRGKLSSDVVLHAERMKELECRIEKVQAKAISKNSLKPKELARPRTRESSEPAAAAAPKDTINSSSTKVVANGKKHVDETKIQSPPTMDDLSVSHSVATQKAGNTMSSPSSEDDLHSVDTAKAGNGVNLSWEAYKNKEAPAAPQIGSTSTVSDIVKRKQKASHDNPTSTSKQLPPRAKSHQRNRLPPHQAGHSKSPASNRAPKLRLKCGVCQTREVFVSQDILKQSGLTKDSKVVCPDCSKDAPTDNVIFFD